MLPPNLMQTLEDGTVVMIMGMGVVFSFLVIMIFSMFFMSKIVRFLNKIFPERVVEQVSASKKISASVEDEIAAAIAIALSR